MIAMLMEQDFYNTVGRCNDAGVEASMGGQLILRCSNMDTSMASGLRGGPSGSAGQIFRGHVLTLRCHSTMARLHKGRKPIFRQTAVIAPSKMPGSRAACRY